MPIHGQCPGCGRKFQAPDRLSGKRVKCPNCSAVIQLGHGDQQRAVRQSTSGEEASQAPTPPEQPSQQKAQWYVKTAAGEQLGPMSKAEVDALVAEGRLDGFCHLRREDWQQWKWAEAVYPQFALPAESEAKAAAKAAPTEIDVPTVVPDAASRLRPCPDCGKRVSKRAGQCPDCGCPLGSPDDQAAAVAAEAAGYQADDTSSVAGSSQERSRAKEQRRNNCHNSEGDSPIFAARKSGQSPTYSFADPKRRQVGLVIAGAVSAVLLIVVVAIVLVWQVWRKVRSAPEDLLQSVGEELSGQNELLQEPIAQRNGKEAQGKAATPEEIERCIKEEAAKAARNLDQLYAKAHSARSALERTQKSADLLRSIIDDPLGKPGDQLTPPAEAEPYRSKYKPLYDECLAYLRKNLSPGELDRSKVRELANRWADGKRGPLEEQLQTQLGL